MHEPSFSETTAFAGLIALSTLALLVLISWFVVLALIALLLISRYVAGRRVDSAASRGDTASITYHSTASPAEPLVTLVPGQELIVPWPFSVQVPLAKGMHLEILESGTDRIRVRAVATQAQ